MGRFGPLTLLFYDADDLATPLEDTLSNSVLYAIDGKSLEGTSEAGWTNLVVPMTPYYDDLIAYNRICVPYYADSIWQAATSDPLGQNFGTGFRIQEIEPFNDAGGAMVRIAGPEESNDLKFGQPIFRPIGEEVVTETTIVGAKTFELSTTLTVGAPNGNFSAAVASTSGVAIGDTIYIAMDGAYGIHEAILDEAVVGSPVHFTPAIPQDAASGAWVMFRRFAAVGLTPINTTLAIGSPNGNDSCTVASVAGINTGDEVRIVMDAGLGTHIGKVKHIEGDLGTNRFTFEPRIPYDAAVGNAVQIRRRKIYVSGAKEAFAKGVELHIELNDLTTHFTRVADDPNEDADGIHIIVEKGIPSAVAAGNYCNVYNYSTPATDDIDQIMFYRPDWTVNFDGAYDGTEDGTFRAPIGDSVYDLLQATAASSGEYWRMTLAPNAGEMVREIDWKRDHDTAGYGGSLRLVMPNQADIATHSADINRAIIAGLLKLKVSGEVLTRVYPIAGDNRVSLALATADGIAYATANGFTIFIPDPDTNLYGYPYIYDAALEADDTIGVRSRTVNFSAVRVNIPKIPELQAAADDLLRQAVNWLLERQNSRTFYDVDGVVSAVPIRAGDKVELYYEDPNGDWTIFRTGGSALYVLEATRTYKATATDEMPEGTSGVPLYSLRLSADSWGEPTVEATSAGIVRDADRSNRIAGGDNSQISISVGSVVTGGGGVTDHGLLTGLGDDDHTQYWNTTRGDAAIATHSADDDAHHALVTVTNPLSLSGQQVGLVLNTNGGLLVSSGLKLDLATVSGLLLTANQLHINLNTNSGLELSSGLKLGTPTTLTAATTNALSTNTHSHAITATDDANTTFSALLKATSEGGLTLGRLAVGTSSDTAATLKAISKANDDYTLFLKQKSGQTADIWRVENSSATPLVRLTGGGNLESGNPAFVSGFTGWRIEGATGDAEFNNIVARGEFHASIFVADEMHATGGTMTLLASAKVTAPVGGSDNTLPGSHGSTLTLNVQAQEVSPYACYFAVNDVIRVKYIRNSLGIITGSADIYFQVTATGSITGQDVANREPGYFPMTVRWLYGGESTYIIPTGTAVVKWGAVSGSGYTGGMLLTTDQQYAPYINIYTIDATQTYSTWQSAPVTPITRMRIGNLRGVLGKSADEWGFAAGSNLSDAATSRKYLVASDLGVTLQNIDLSLYNSGTKTVEIGNTGDVKFGTAVSADATTTFQHTASNGQVRIGPLGSGMPNLFWGGTNLHLRQNATPIISLNGDGSSEFSGPMTIGTDGGIWQGTGSFATPTTGLKIWRDSGVGRLATYSGGVEQVTIDTSGRLTAGADAVRLDSGGLKIVATDSYSTTTALNFVSPTSGTYVGGIELSYDPTGGDKITSARFGVVDLWADVDVKASLSLVTKEFTVGGTGHSIILQVPNAHLTLFQLDDGSTYGRTSADYLELDGELRATGGISVGSYFAPNQGQVVSDIAGENWNAVVLADTTDIAHGMTSVVHTSSYGTLGKNLDDSGGLLVGGYGETIVGLNLAGYGTTVSATEATSSNAAVQVSAYLKSGTSTTTYGNDDNIFAVRNNTAVQLIVKGNGDLFLNGTNSGTFDFYDDVMMVRGYDLSLAGQLDAEWEQRLNTNRPMLEAARVITYNEDGRHFVNVSRMQRLIMGAVWQLHERLVTLEGRGK